MQPHTQVLSIWLCLHSYKVTCTHTHTHVHTRVHTHIHTHMYTHVYTHISTHTHTCTHAHTHTDGEDGVVKIWSRSGMLRTILVQSGNQLVTHDHHFTWPSHASHMWVTWHHILHHMQVTYCITCKSHVSHMQVTYCITCKSHDLSPQVPQSTQAAGLQTRTMSSIQVGKPWSLNLSNPH